MKKIFYNADGWVCQRYPYDIPVDNESRFIEVEDEQEDKTYATSSGYAWRVVDGKLVNEVYDKTLVDNRETANKISELKAELAKIKEDIEQETFGIVRDDFSDKKARAAEIINELRALEGKEPREIKPNKE